MKNSDILFKWSVQNSFLILLLVTGYFLKLIDITILSIFSFVSFCFLIFNGRKLWTPQGHFGLANLITTVKLLCLCTNVVLFSFGNFDVENVGVLLIILVFLDKLDGTAARFFNESSLFGEVFDSEVDAFTTLIATVILFQINSTFGWFMIVGVLRYLYVVTIWWFDPPIKKEESKLLNRILGVLLSFSYAFLIIDQKNIFLYLAILFSILIGWSFAKDLYRVLGTAKRSQ